MRLLLLTTLLACLAAACNRALIPAPDNVIWYAENLDRLQCSADPSDKSDLAINTRRNYRPFCIALRAALDPEMRIEDLYNSPGDFPDEGSYSWKNIQIGSLKNLQMVLSIESDEENYTLTFNCFDAAGLYCQNHPEIVRFFENHIRQHLINQAVEIIPERPVLVLEDAFIEKHFSAEIAALNKLVTRHFPEHTTGLWIDLIVDKHGKAAFAGPTDFPLHGREIIGNWIDQHKFPIIKYENTNDTAQYSISWSAWVDDSVILPHIEKRLRRGEPADTSGYVLAEIIPADSLKTPWPLLLIITGKAEAHFFRFTATDMIPAGKFSFTDPGGAHIEWTDYNYDGIPEIELVSFGNMNGNSLRHIYHWDQQQQQIVLAGSFFGDLERLPERGEVLHAYYGSWYMPRERTLYRWMNGRLVPRAKRVARIRTPDMIPNNCCIFEIYENPAFAQGLDSLQLVSRKFILDEEAGSEGAYEEQFFNEMMKQK